MNMDEIFGLVDQTIDNLEKHGGRVPKPAPRPKRLPKLNVKRSTVPKELASVDAGNVVYVPDSELKALASQLNTETSKLTRLLIKRLMPKLLAYQTSLTYTQAALKEGLDVEVSFDSGLAECVKCVGYLDIVYHFLKSSTVPVSMRRKFGEAFAERLAAYAIEAMVTTNKSEQKRTQMQDLQAVVYSHQERKMQRKEKEEQKPTAVKRSRRSP